MPDYSPPSLTFPDPREATNPAGTVTKSRIPHPYARIYTMKEENKKGAAEGKRRKIWSHNLTLEKSLFSPYELLTMGAPHRRKIYVANLEAHIDQLHTQLLDLGLWPIRFEDLEPLKGLNPKTAKSMVSGIHHDVSEIKLKLLELQRGNDSLADDIQASK